jgi:glutaminase
MTDGLGAHELQALIERIVDEVRPEAANGKVADYIPALAKVDAHKLGMAITTVDGLRLSAGDAHEPFSLQSITKVFTLTLALELTGAELWKRVGREPSGTPFNSLVQLEYERGIPRNPLINAGALVVTDAIVEAVKDRAAAQAIVEFLRVCADNPAIQIDEEVAQSEKAWGSRNAALANLIKAFGNIRSPVDDVLDAYFHQCAIAMSCADLSRAVLFLAGGGRDPLAKRKFISAQRTRRINAIMLTCGHYDASGEFAFRVGLPAKSGVGGGIVAVVPGRMGVAVWSPALSPQGNSLAGTMALEKFAAATGCSIFS